MSYVLEEHRVWEKQKLIRRPQANLVVRGTVATTITYRGLLQLLLSIKVYDNTFQMIHVQIT
jgi:hypothetical protein